MYVLKKWDIMKIDEEAWVYLHMNMNEYYEYMKNLCGVKLLIYIELNNAWFKEWGFLNYCLFFLKEHFLKYMYDVIELKE